METFIELREWENTQLLPTETTGKLLLLAPAETTKHVPHKTTLGLVYKVPGSYSTAFVVSKETLLLHQARREVVAGFQPRGDTGAMCIMVSVGLEREAQSRVTGIWLRNTRAIVFRGNKRVC